MYNKIMWTSHIQLKMFLPNYSWFINIELCVTEVNNGDPTFLIFDSIFKEVANLVPAGHKVIITCL